MNAELITNLMMVGLLLLSIIFLAISSVVKEKQKQQKKNCTEKTTAKVIKMDLDHHKLSYNGPYTNYWVPIFEYYVNGERYIRTGSFGYSTEVFSKGQEVEICYNPNNPDEFYAANEEQDKVARILRLVGAILFVYAVAIWIIGRVFVRN